MKNTGHKFKKGHPFYPGTKLFKKGMIPWNKGRNHHHCEKCNKRVINKGTKLCRECWCKSKPLPPQTGKKLSLELRNKLRLSHLGQKAWNKGKGNAGKRFTYPSIFYNEFFRNKIKQRDNHKCQNCGVTDEEHIIVFGTGLHLHHINYNKLDCSEQNLITVCGACNARANYNKWYWKEYYSNFLPNVLNKLEIK